MPTLQQKRLLLGRAGALTFLLRDDFTTAASAPLTSPRTCEPGPGTLTITDTNNKLSVASGKLTFATGGVGAGDPGIWGSVLLVRLAGRTVMASVVCSSSAIEVGWDSNQNVSVTDCFRVATSGTTLRDGGAVIDGGLTISGVTSYLVAVVQRGAGFFAFIKGGIYTNWTLIWVSISTSTSVYPAISGTFTAVIGTVDNFRVLDLPAPFNDSYGIATQRLAGARSGGDTFTHTANCVLEYTQTTLPSASNSDFRFRRQDATNYWQVTIDSTGAFTLNEVVAGTPTQRATAAGVVSSGHRIVIVADSTTIRGYSNNVLRWTYSSASNFATATAGELTALGTTGAVSEVISWPRVLAAAPAALLDLAVA